MPFAVQHPGYIYNYSVYLYINLNYSDKPFLSSVLMKLPIKSPEKYHFVLNVLFLPFSLVGSISNLRGSSLS